MTRVLLIDEDQRLCRVLGEFLIRAGMTVQFAHDGKSGLRSALTGQHDLVVLCDALPELAGLQLTKQLRTHSDIGILMLSAHGIEGDKIVALECGADDYLDKPLRPRELVARIRAITRRVKLSSTRKFGSTPERFEIGDIVVDEGSRECCRNGRIIDLTAAEFDLLILFLRHSGRVIHRTELSRRVLDREYSPFDRSIDVHVSNLRRKLGARPDGTERIRSVRNIGYIYAHSAPTQSHGSLLSIPQLCDSPYSHDHSRQL